MVFLIDDTKALKLSKFSGRDINLYQQAGTHQTCADTVAMATFEFKIQDLTGDIFKNITMILPLLILKI